MANRITQLTFIFLSFIFSSCNNKPGDNYSNNMEVRAARNMKGKCDSVYYKIINFDITHEKLDSSDLSKFKLIIDIEGIVYNGVYKRNTSIENFELCSDFAMNHTELNIYLIDEKSKVKYKWRNKMLFSFEKYTTFKLVLKSKYDPNSETDLNSYTIDYN